jgi:hypothetical protein
MYLEVTLSNPILVYQLLWGIVWFSCIQILGLHMHVGHRDFCRNLFKFIIYHFYGLMLRSMRHSIIRQISVLKVLLAAQVSEWLYIVKIIMKLLEVARDFIYKKSYMITWISNLVFIPQSLWLAEKSVLMW